MDLATRDLDVGDVISTNRPLVHVVSKEMKNVVCDHCLTRRPLKRCAGCKKMFYCDSRCHMDDWAVHKFECSIFTKHYDRIIGGPGSDDRFLLRLFLLLDNEPVHESTLYYDKTAKRTYEQLMTHAEEMAANRLSAMEFEEICDKLAECDIEFDRSKLFEHFCKMNINSFGICNKNLKVIATGLYVAESMFDHSCSPNAVQLFTGSRLQIRTMKNIKKGEKITISYIYTNLPKSIRQQNLKEIFYFDCQCERCEQDTPKDFDYQKLETLLRQIKQLFGEHKWEEAWTMGKEISELFAILYDGLHPALSTFLVTLLVARLRSPVNIDSEVKQLVLNIDNMIKLTHSPDHLTYKLFERCKIDFIARQMLNKLNI